MKDTNLQANNQANSDAEARGDDHREVQDNGTQGKTSYQMGDPSGNSFPDSGKPADERWTPGEASEAGTDLLEIDDYGLKESVEVANNQSIANYGVEGPAAGGGLKRNTIT